MFYKLITDLQISCTQQLYFKIRKCIDMKVYSMRITQAYCALMRNCKNTLCNKKCPIIPSRALI
jgi:hypothetical protein